jgi:hypothetical protein
VVKASVDGVATRVVHGGSFDAILIALTGSVRPALEDVPEQYVLKDIFHSPAAVSALMSTFVKVLFSTWRCRSPFVTWLAAVSPKNIPLRPQILSHLFPFAPLPDVLEHQRASVEHTDTR